MVKVQERYRAFLQQCIVCVSLHVQIRFSGETPRAKLGRLPLSVGP